MNLPSDVQTRWFSAKHMMEGAIALRLKPDQYFASKLGGTGGIHNLTNEQWKEGEDIIQPLSAFEDMGVECSASNYPAFQLALPTIA